MKTTSLLDQKITPYEMMEAVKEDRKLLSPRQTVAGSHTKEWRECWLAASFGIGYSLWAEPCEISVLSGTGFPDFQLITGTGSFGFENVMILRAGRRLGDEYREIEKVISKGTSYIRHISDEEMTRNEESLPGLIRQAIEKKLAKYGGGTSNINLCIYTNLFAPDVQIDKIQNECKGLEVSFASIWLITGIYIATLFNSPQNSLITVDGFGEYETNF